MLITVENVSAYCAVLTLSALFINKVVVEPLKNSIDRLTETTKTLTEEVQKQHERMALAEASLKSSHKRLDTFEERLQAVEHKCETCDCKK